MSYQKLQAKGAYANFSIEPRQIDENFDPLAGGKHAVWQLGLINTTPQEFALASLCHDGETYGAWFRISAVRNNCPTGYEECFDGQKWNTILALPKDARPFSIRIATLPNAFGQATGAEFLAIAPSAGFDGGVLGISIDG